MASLAIAMASFLCCGNFMTINQEVLLFIPYFFHNRPIQINVILLFFSYSSCRFELQLPSNMGAALRVLFPTSFQEIIQPEEDLYF